VRIVVTGASGNVGTALLRRLHEAGGWQVTGVVRRPPDPTSAPYRWADWVACDLGAFDATDRLVDVLTGADAVVHLAWSINPSRTDPPMDHTNLAGTGNLLRAVAAAEVSQLVCASSVAAYRPPARWRKVAEDWPCDGVPGSAYSRGKAQLEVLLDRFAAEQPDVSVARIRPCAIVQRDAAGEFARWLLSPLLPEGVLGRRWLSLPFWPGLRAQVVHADDVAEAIRLILRQRALGAFNIAGEGVLGAARLAETVGGFHLSVPRPLVLAAAWAGWRTGLQPTHPGWLRLADQAALVTTTRARTVLGWRPRYGSEDALTELVTAMRAGQGTASAPLAPRDLRGVADRLRAIRWGTPSHQAQS
jgi:nucleoside-diphosphate-sugar epimerase